MTETETHIRSTLDRVVNTFTARPGSARGTYNARVEAGEGLTATAREGDWTLDFDMPEALGGAGTAPTPGVYARTTLLACLAIGLRMEALREGLPHARIAVAMECDCDNRGLFGIGEVPPGYEDFRLMVEVESDAPESELRAWLNRTLGHSPWLDVFRRPQPVSIELLVVPPAEDCPKCRRSGWMPSSWTFPTRALTPPSAHLG